MTRTEIEQKLWADQFNWGMIESEDRSIACEVADAAVAEFRKRYPVEPAAPKQVWYDEPPFPRDGTSYPCWVEGWVYPVRVAYVCGEWQWTHGSDGWRPLNGRRVSPIVKPQEPTT